VGSHEQRERRDGKEECSQYSGCLVVEDRSQAEDAENRQTEQDRIDEERGAQPPAAGPEQPEARRMGPAPPVPVEENFLALERIRNERRLEPRAARPEALPLKRI